MKLRYTTVLGFAFALGFSASGVSAVCPHLSGQYGYTFNIPNLQQTVAFDVKIAQKGCEKITLTKSEAANKSQSSMQVLVTDGKLTPDLNEIGSADALSYRAHFEGNSLVLENYEDTPASRLGSKTVLTLNESGNLTAVTTIYDDAGNLLGVPNTTAMIKQ